MKRSVADLEHRASQGFARRHARASRARAGSGLQNPPLGARAASDRGEPVDKAGTEAVNLPTLPALVISGPLITRRPRERSKSADPGWLVTVISNACGVRQVASPENVERSCLRRWKIIPEG